MTKNILAVILGLLLLVGIAVGGYQLEWWLKEDRTDRQVEIDNRNTGTQTAWADQVRADIRQIAGLPEGSTAARGALVNDACSLIPRLTEPYLTSDIVAFQLENC